MQIYKNDKLCTTLPYSGAYVYVYDSVFYNNSLLIDVENSNKVIRTIKFSKKIIKSDTRAYMTQGSSITGYTIKEITNVLD